MADGDDEAPLMNEEERENEAENSSGDEDEGKVYCLSSIFISIDNHVQICGALILNKG